MFLVQMKRLVLFRFLSRLIDILINVGIHSSYSTYLMLFITHMHRYHSRTLDLKSTTIVPTSNFKKQLLKGCVKKSSMVVFSLKHSQVLFFHEALIGHS